MWHLRHKLWIFWFHRKVLFCSRDIQVFRIFKHPMIYQIRDVMMSINTWDKVHFWIYLLNQNSPKLSHQICPIGRYFSTVIFFWNLLNDLEDLSKVPGSFQFSKLSNQLCQIYSVHFFEKVRKRDKYQLLKIDRSCYIAISLKFKKCLELVASLQHWVKNMLEMFSIRYARIWPNFILIVLRIQKK